MLPRCLKSGTTLTVAFFLSSENVEVDIDKLKRYVNDEAMTDAGVLASWNQSDIPDF